jgi:hypothetical protein
MPASRRDPVSELFDRGARTLLSRAYARPGQWVGTRVAFPSARQIAHFGGQGINVLGQDQWGRDRWAAGFVRAVYYQHKWFYSQGRLRSEKRMAANDARSIRYELGRRIPVLGVIPAGRAVRIMVNPGGQAAMKAVKRLPDSRRIYEDSGAPGGRWADPAARDW